MHSLVAIVTPHPSGQSFSAIIAKLHQPDESLERFELDILRRHDGIQGDMVFERLEDVLAPWMRKLVNQLEHELKTARQQARK